MSDEDLIKEVAEVVMRWREIPLPYGGTCLHDGEKFISFKGFEPLTNANHLELVRDKVRDLGYCLTERTDICLYFIQVKYKHVDVYKKAFNKKDWPKTQLEAMLEAVKKMEVKK